MKIKDFFKSKKIFLLSLIIPLIMFIYTLLTYKNPHACGGLKISRPCTSYFDFLSGFNGKIFLFFDILSLLLSLNLIGIIYCFLNKKKKIGWILTAIFVIILLYIFSQM